MSNLQREALDEFENLARAHRHSLRNTLAASRLLIGAYASWEVDEQTYRTAFEVLKRRDAAAIDVEDHIVAMRELRPAAPKDGTRPLMETFSDHPCLVVDDQLDEAGWRAVMTAILGQNTRFEATGKAALERLADHAHDTALVLLDLGLPRSEDGLAALRLIKAYHPDLPVVIFSAFDDIPLARRCFAAGAAGYYVKELDSPERNSLAYYRKLRETLLEALPPVELRRLWRRISTLREAAPREEAGARSYAGVARSFERAWFFLAADDSDPRLRLLFDGRPGVEANVYSHALLESVFALEHLIEELFPNLESPRRKYARWALKVERDDSQTFGKKLRRLRDSGALPIVESETAQRLWESRNRIVHEGRRIDRPTALTQVADCLEVCGALLRPEPR